MYRKKVWNTLKKCIWKYKFIFFKKTKSSDSVLKFLIARLQWIGFLARTFSGPKIVKLIHIVVSLKHLIQSRHL